MASKGAKRSRSDSYTPRAPPPGSRATSKGRAPSSELKFLDTALSFLFDSTTEVPATGQLNLIPQGAGESTRVGRKCVLKSVQLRGTMAFSPAAAASAAVAAYMWLVWDKQANSAAAAVTDVFTSNVANSLLRNMSNSERFVILKKWCWNFNSTAGVTTAYNAVRQDMEYYTKCNIPLEFSGTDGSIGTIKSNNVFLVAGGVGDDLVSFDGVCRVRFSDSS